MGLEFKTLQARSNQPIGKNKKKKKKKNLLTDL
jgi:hypothetical protein